MQATERVLRVEGIAKAFPGVQALDHVTLDIKPGEVHALVGENGAGKTTLMNIIFGALRPDAGAIYLNGERAAIEEPRDALRHGIAMIFQEISLFPDLSVAENIFLNRLPRRGRSALIDWPKLQADAGDVLNRIGLNLDPGMPVKDLSIGHQQLVEIARAMSAQARLVIMDEPTSSLSELETRKLFELIRLLKADHVAVIYISHRLEEIFSIADRVSVLRDGKSVATLEVSAVNREVLVALMVGRPVAELYAERKPAEGRPIFKVDHLTRAGFFEDINFALGAGEVLGFYGLVGAGRTELALSLSGHHPVESGGIFMQGAPVRLRSPQDALACGIAYLPEERKADSLFPILSVKDNISLSTIRARSKFTWIDQEHERLIANDYVERLRIRTPSIDKTIETLSGGNQQKAVMARILALQPKIMILDEPTRGIDVGAKSEIYQIVAGLAGQGVGIILISSELPEVLGMADRIVVMRSGRITGTFLRAEADEEKLLHAASF